MRDYSMTPEREAQRAAFKEWINSIEFVDKDFNIIDPGLVDDPEPDPGD